MKKTMLQILLTFILLFAASTIVRAADTGIVYGNEEQTIVTAIPNIPEVVIPEGVTEVRLRLTQLDKVEKLVLPSTLEQLDLPTMSYTQVGGLSEFLNNLTEIEIAEENAIFSYQDGVLYKENRILIVLPQSVKGDLVLPSHIEIIPYRAFMNCDKLTTITLPKDFKYTYDGTHTEEIYSCELFSGCDNLKAIYVEEGNPYVKSIDGLLYTAETGKLLCCPQGRKGTLTVPEGTITIGEGSIVGCDELTVIKFPYGVVHIEAYAIYGCNNLQKLIIPSTVRHIGYVAIRACDNLKTIKLQGKPPIKMTEEIVAECSGLEKILVPKGYKGQYAEVFKQSHNKKLIKYLKEAKYKVQTKKIKKIDKAEGTVDILYDQKTIEISWHMVPYAEYYKLQMKRNGKWITLDTIKTPIDQYDTIYQTTAKKLKDGGVYKFRIVSYFNKSVKSISEVYKICYLRKTEFKSIKNAKEGTLVVKWKKTPGITKYVVQVEGVKHKYLERKTITDGKTKLKITGLEKGKTYRVIIVKYKKVAGKMWEALGSKKITITK